MKANATIKAAPAACPIHLSAEAREAIGSCPVIPRDNGMGSVVHAMKFR